MRADAPRNARTGDGVVFRASLGDVMKQHCHIENAAVRLDVRDELVSEWMHLGLAALLDGSQNADAAQEMLVHRVVVVHGELHHGDDLA